MELFGYLMQVYIPKCHRFVAVILSTVARVVNDPFPYFRYETLIAQQNNVSLHYFQDEK